MLDLRLPSGLFFAAAGLILVVLGIASKPQAPMTAANVDLYAGAVMVLFGGLLLALAARGHKG